MPRRVPSPVNQCARPVVEPIIQPLYDSEQIANATLQIVLFQNPIGQNSLVGTAVRKTLRLTNMETAGQLASPKFHIIHAIRVHPTNLVTAETSVYDSNIEDLAEVLFRSFFVLHIGTKDYVVGPTFIFPSNIGIGSPVAAAMSPATGNNNLVARWTYPVGPLYRLWRFPIRIPPQQGFNASINIPTALANLAAGRWWTVMLDGRFGREVQ